MKEGPDTTVAPRYLHSFTYSIGSSPKKNQYYSYVLPLATPFVQRPSAPALNQIRHVDVHPSIYSGSASSSSSTSGKRQYADAPPSNGRLFQEIRPFPLQQKTNSRRQVTDRRGERGRDMRKRGDESLQFGVPH